MPYPKPRTGSQYLSQYYVASYGNKSAPCLPAVISHNLDESAFGGGFGYRSPVIKSDGVRPTNYQVYWSYVDKGRCWFSPSHTVNCVERETVWPFDIIRNDSYRRSANSEITRMFGAIAISHFNNGRYPGGTSRLGTLPSCLGPITRIRTSHQNVINALDNKILLELSNQTNQLGITLAESFKTSKYLIDRVTDVTKFLIMLKGVPKRFFKFLKKNYKRWSGNMDHSKRTAYRTKVRGQLRRRRWDSELGGRWLEYNYAIMPNVYEVNGLLEFADPASAHPIVFSIKKRDKLTENYYTSNLSSVSARAEMKYKFLVSRTFMIDDPFYHTLNRLGLNPTQFILGTAYELIPFSFVADWVLGFNDLLKGMNAMQGVKYLHGYHSISLSAVEHIVEDTDYTGASIPATAFGDLSAIPEAPYTMEALNRANGQKPRRGICMPFRYRTKAFKRTVLTAPPTYTYGVNVIGTSKQRLATLLSLFAVLRK